MKTDLQQVWVKQGFLIYNYFKAIKIHNRSELGYVSWRNGF